MRTHEHREHTRIEADVACVVEDKAAGRIRNVSFGGALLRCPPVDADVDDMVSVELRPMDGEPAKVTAEVVRVTELGDVGQNEYGLQFLGVESEPYQRFSTVLRQLMEGRGGGLRRTPRLHRRLPLRCRTGKEFAGTMNNISRGGLGLECAEPVAMGERIGVDVYMTASGPELSVTGFVTRVEVDPKGIFQAGVAFGPLASEQTNRLEALLQSMFRGW